MLVSLPIAYENYKDLELFCKENNFKISKHWVLQDYGGHIFIEYNTEIDYNKIINWKYKIDSKQNLQSRKTHQ